MVICAGCGQTAAFPDLRGGDELCERCARDRREAGVDRSVLTALDGGLECVAEGDPVGEAYGFQRALDVAGLPSAERARVLRGRPARAPAGLLPLALAPALVRDERMGATP
jgi:hypothetical protein